MDIHDAVQKGFDDLVAFANEPQGDDVTTSGTHNVSNSWEKLEEKYGVTIYKKNDGMAIKCCKGVGVIENVTPKMVFETINDAERAKEWDKMLVESRVVKMLNDKIGIVYVSTRGQFPIAPRDFCLAVSHRIESDGTYLQLSRSIEDPSVPLISGKVRAELLTSGFIIKPLVQVNGVTKYSCKVTYVVQFDPKGLIPSFLANKVAEYQPLRIAKIRSIMKRMNANIPMEISLENSVKEGKQEETQIISNSMESQFTSPERISNNHFVHTIQESDQSDSENDKFEDPINDFSNIGDDMKACLSTIQNEVTSLQSNLQKAQGQIYLMENSIAESGKVVGLDNLSKRANSSSLLPVYLSRLKQMIEQQNLDINVQRKREELNQKRLENITLRLDFLEKSTSARLYLANWKGKLIFLFTVFVWPLVTFKVWIFFRKRLSFRKLVEKLSFFLGSFFLDY